MFKQKLYMQVNGKNDRVYEVHCNNSSPLGELYDALSVMRANVMTLMKEQDEKEKMNNESSNIEEKADEQ